MRTLKMSLPAAFVRVSREEKGSLKKDQEVPLGDGAVPLPFHPFLLGISAVASETHPLHSHQPLHLLVLLLFIPSEHVLPASAAPSISEVKFLINSVCGILQ